MKKPLIYLGIILTCLATTSRASAQIAADGTVSTQVNQSGSLNFNITGGQRVGQNLLHSFSQFSLPTNGAAIFNNNLDIQNIISRVTGNSISDIDGLIKTQGNANLILLNPKGIRFGANAQLNIGGSFLATTASSILFDDGSEFSATSPQTQPLLKISTPIGLQFGTKAGAITVNGSGHNVSLSPEYPYPFVRGQTETSLQVPASKTLALVGSGVQLIGGNVIAESGQIYLGSVAPNNLVKLGSTAEGWVFDYQNVAKFGDIQLAQKASVDVSSSGQGAGNIQINAQQVNLTDGSAIFAIPDSNKPGGNITINASDVVQLIGLDASLMFPTAIFNDNRGSAPTGEVNITTGRLLVKDGAAITTSTLSDAPGGKLTVKATDVEISGSVDTNLVVEDGDLLTLYSKLDSTSFGSGVAGDLTIDTQRLIVRDEGFILASATDSGDAGTLTVNATDSVEVNNAGALYAYTLGTGNANNLTINTQRLLLNNGGGIIVDTYSEGNGGNLTINASESVEVKGTDTYLTAETYGTGKAQNLTINTGHLLVRGGGQISASSGGQGDAGNLSVNADLVELIGASRDNETASGLFAQARDTGNAGNLIINTQRLIVSDGAKADASTYMSGRGGNLVVNASDSVQVSGNFIFDSDNQIPSLLSVRSVREDEPDTGTGDAGNLLLQSPVLQVSNGAEVSVNATGIGKGGLLDVKADAIRLSGGGKLNSETALSDGGNISLTAQSLQMRTNSQITATAGGAGNGGNLTFQIADTIVGLENSDITANAVKGRGGNIQINTSGIFGSQFRPNLTSGNDITASSEFGVSGSVQISTPGVDPSEGLTQLPSKPIDVTGLVASTCSSSSTLASSLVISGKGGLPNNPLETLSSNTVLADLGTTKVDSSARTQTLQSASVKTQSQLVEAQGWSVNSQGKVVLLANVSAVTPHAQWSTTPGCK